MKKMKVGIIGTGNISGIYLESPKTMPVLDIVACADLDVDRAKAQAEKYGVPKGYSVEDLLADPEIELVINLTIPGAHFEVCKKVLEAGKHVYVEKPLSIDLKDGEELIKLAKEKGLRIGGAPDTFLGGGHQTCRKLIDDGWIGEPIAATAFMLGGGPEDWHPNPDFFYQKGGGPMFDMGPYYLTAFVNLIGPVKRVTGSARVTFPERTILSEPKYKEKIQVEIPTHIAGVLDFENGAIATLVTSFDIKAGSDLPNIEIYGTEGTMKVHDPNYFGGEISVRRHGASEWTEIPLSHGFSENSRGIGAADMAFAILNNRNHRASGELALHVLEIMHAIHEASEKGEHVYLKNRCARPEPFPIGLNKDNLELINK
ncbi:Gfo/Idh/MocA family oxidoreductase [Neobacillus drentensis]|uniref:Gfo/Idh/MocA family protein n=1 Tax=Neobacillus drentensis TaxID=220684 RepID=UPI002FFF019D